MYTNHIRGCTAHLFSLGTTLIVCTLTANNIALGQADSRHDHVVSDTRVSYGTVVQWVEGAPGCEQRWSNGDRVRTIRLPDVLASLSMKVENHNFVALIVLRNPSNKPIDILPSNFSLQITDPQGKEMMALSPDKVMAKRSIGEVIAVAAAGGANGWTAASQRRTATATVTSSDGTTSQVDVYSTGPTPQEIEQQRQTAEAQRARTDAMSQYNQWILEHALFANTLEPQKVIAGIVYFHREKRKYREFVVRMPIAGATLEFPFEF